jgi:hypothetical protein
MTQENAVIPQQIGLREPYDHVKGCNCVARQGRKAKISSQVALSPGEHDRMRASRSRSDTHGAYPGVFAVRHVPVAQWNVHGVPVWEIPILALPTAWCATGIYHFAKKRRTA